MDDVWSPKNNPSDSYNKVKIDCGSYDLYTRHLKTIRINQLQDG